MKQKTAVEWLYDQLMTTDVKDHVELLIKAKEIEKQQMADAFYAPANEAESNNFDEYYTQKYKDEN
jgi:hypothetical protein